MSENNSSQEHDAIRRCKTGEVSALEVLYQLHHKAIFQTSLGITRNHSLAEDVTQQVFIELYASIERYDDSRPFAPWLHRISVHRSLNELRRHENRNLPIDVAYDVVATTNSPEKAAEDSELRETILESVGMLDPKHRAVVVLRFYHGFSEAEMAISLDCSRGTVKSRLHYAIQNLRESVANSSSQVQVNSPSREMINEELTSREHIDSMKPLQDQEL